MSQEYVELLEYELQCLQDKHDALAARLAEAERLLGESVHCVESWKRKHERALKAATKKADADYMEWHAEQVTAAVDLLARITKAIVTDCPKCKGTGAEPSGTSYGGQDEMLACDACNGSGERRTDSATGGQK